ncbi:MAG: tetratricopeptide repeat protein [Vicinamibacteria bacterium]|nr:tetratricopeptide repeat protein [Vicinamibacteria bacterium]
MAVLGCAGLLGACAGTLHGAPGSGTGGDEHGSQAVERALELADSGSDEAIAAAEEAIQEAVAQVRPVEEGYGQIALCLARRARGEYVRARTAGERALMLATEHGEVALAARAHNALGVLAGSRDDLAAALLHALEEQRLFEQVGDRRGLAQSLNNLGNAYRRLADHPRAIENHERSLALKREMGDRDGAGYSFHNLGETLLASGAPEPALVAFESAEAEWRAVGNRRAVAAALKSRGFALAELGRLPDALAALQASLELRRDPPNPHGEAETLVGLGRVLLRLDRPGEAVSTLERAREIAGRLAEPQLQADVMAGLAAAHGARGDLRAREAALARQVEVQERWRQLRLEAQQREARALFEIRSAADRAERATRQAMEQERSAQRRTSERNLALAALALLVGLIALGVNRYRVKRDAEARLRRQATDLEVALSRVRTLSGLLPLCGWCHQQVRETDGNWSRLEAYVESHTDARITHGICPDCQAAHFPKGGR